MKNKILTLLLILLPAIRSLAAETTTHDISTGPLSITQGGSYTVTGKSYETDYAITINVADGQVVDLTLKDIYIYTSDTHPIEIRNGEVRLTLEGDNYLTNNNKSVVQVSPNGSLTIDGPGYLDVNGDYDYPTFGDQDHPDTATNVTILGGTINVQSGQSAPLSIRGGSVGGRFTEKTGKRRATATLVNQGGPMKYTNITTLTQPEGYGCLGMRTDSEGKLYLWLPEGEQTVSLRPEGDERIFAGSIDVKDPYTNEFIISPRGTREVSYSSNLYIELKGFPAYAEAGKEFTFSIEYEDRSPEIGIISITAEGVEIRPTGKPDQYTFTMPDHDVEIRLKGTDLKVITDVEEGTELIEQNGQNELLIKKGGAYTITPYSSRTVTTPIRIADDVTGDVALTLKDLYTESDPAIDCGKGSRQTTLIIEGENGLYSTSNPSVPTIRKGNEGTLIIDGTGTLELNSSHGYMIGNPEGETANITINGGSIRTNLYHDHTIFGPGKNISVTGGSIHPGTGPLTSIGLADRHLAVVAGCDPKAIIRDFSYGDTPYNLRGMLPDKEGKLYLWLPAGEQALTLVTEGNITYTGTVTIAENTVNTCTLTPEEGTYAISLDRNEDLTDRIQVASLGKAGETIGFTARSDEEISWSDRDFLFEFDTTPNDLVITRSPDDPDRYSFIMPDEAVTLTPRPVAYDVVTDQTEGYRSLFEEGCYLVITQPGTYTISNKEGLPVSGVPIWIVHPDLLQGTKPEDLKPIGPVTIVLDGVDISFDKGPNCIMNLSSTEVNLRSAEGSVNKLRNKETSPIANTSGSLTIGGPGKLILEGAGEAELIGSLTPVTIENTRLETTNLDEDGLNRKKYGISTRTSHLDFPKTECPPFPLHIKSGTLTADYIGAPETEAHRQPVTISGGSIRCEELRGAVSAEGTPLLRTIVTLPSGKTRTAQAPGDEEILITSYSGLGGYSLDNTYADSEGKLYLWLPEGATYTDVHINNGVGSVTAGQDVTLSLEEIIPDITYYTVSLPALEGATTQPGAGTYTVEEGTDFSFTLTLAEGYDQSVPTVTLSDGRTLAPDSRNQYVISNVTTDLAVSITGIEPNIPDITYYTVTLPQIVGATTDPVAGEYEVEAWSSFRFYLTLDKEYDQSSPIVTTDRGETITPRASDGAYIIKYVRQPIAIHIDGIVRNPDPVANETISTNETTVRAEGAYLHLHTSKPETIFIYTFNGTLLKRYPALSGDKTVRLPQGNYIVIAGEKRFKVQTGK